MEYITKLPVNPRLSVSILAGGLAALFAAYQGWPAWLGMFILAAVTGFLMFFYKFPKFTLYGFLVFTLFQELIYRNLNGFGPVKQIEEAFILMTLCGVFISALNYRESLKNPLNKYFLLIMALGLLSGMANNVPMRTSLMGMFLFVKGYLIYLVFSSQKYTNVDLRRLFTFLGVVAAVIFFFGMIDLVAPTSFRSLIGNSVYVEYRAGIPSVQSIFVHPVLYGWFMSFTGLFIFAAALVFPNNKYKVFLIPAIFGVVSSMRAKAIFGFFLSAAAGFFPGMKGRRSSSLGMMAVLLILLLLVFNAQIGEIVNSILKNYVNIGNNMDVSRNALYITSWKLAVDNFPFGAGFGRFASWISRVNYSPVYLLYGLSGIYGLSPENPLFINDTFWPNVLGEVGFIGLALYLLVIFTMLFRLGRGFFQSVNALHKVLFLGTFMALIEAMLEAVAAPVFVNPPQYVFIFAALGICTSLLREYGQGTIRTGLKD